MRITHSGTTCSIHACTIFFSAHQGIFQLEIHESVVQNRMYHKVKLQDTFNKEKFKDVLVILDCILGIAYNNEVLLENVCQRVCKFVHTAGTGTRTDTGNRTKSDGS